jgi:hypothetical protein
VTDLAALHEALDAATLAAFIAEGGDRDCAADAVLEASFAAAGAFPPGSPGAAALGVIFDAILEAA